MGLRPRRMVRRRRRRARRRVMLVGGMVAFSKRWQVFVDVGTDFDAGWVFAVGPTLRF